MKIVIYFSVLFFGLLVAGCPNLSTDPPKSANADLSSLTVSSGTLVPAFSAATTAYAVTVFNAVTSMTVSGTVSDVSASVSGLVNLSGLVATIPQVASLSVRAQDGTVKTYSVTITRSQDYFSANVGLLKYVPGGTFQRDATSTNTSTVSAFRIGEKEITRAQFLAIMGADPSDISKSSTINSGKDDPVQMVNWYQAIAFCNKASLAEGLTPVYSVTAINFATLTFAAIPTGANTTWDAAVADWTANGYRLPAEMEWMWAAMGALQDSLPGDVSGGVNIGGYAKAFAGSNGSNLIGDYAWLFTNSLNITHPDGTKLSNELGLFDVGGNVVEWNWDWYAAFPTGPVTNYHGTSGTARSLRGGGWNTSTIAAAISAQSSLSQNTQGNQFGIRVIRN